jgi:hypothetical protein
MRPPSRFIGSLTAQQISLLNEIMCTSLSYRKRQCAHAVILSCRGYTVRAIEEIYELDRDTVSAWLVNFEEFGLCTRHI